jgi:hypothetical protein
MKKYLIHLIFVLLLLLLFLKLLSTGKDNEPFVVMTPPHTIKDNKKNYDRKKSFCVIS